MRVEVAYIKSSQTYYVVIMDGNCVECVYDTSIARLLNINVIDYKKELLKYGAYDIKEECIFHTKEDAQRAVDEFVLPNLIMQKLIS